jgi:CopG family transcriptional regulator/antitoxin EndoAI
LRLLDRVAPKGARSRVVDDAVRFFIEAHGRKKLARLLRAGARARAARDRALAEEWFALSDQP